MITRFKFLWVVVCLSSSCDLHRLEAPGNLVPPTAAEDNRLPQIEITVENRTRAIHLETFGDPAKPPLFVLHGGPGADFKLFLPLTVLADSFYVVMWDSRGAGLSERVSKEELSIDSFDEEILRIKEALAPDKKINLVGHSFGGAVVARFAARHPEHVEDLILITPNILNNAFKASSNGGLISFLDGQDFFWQNEILTSKDHAAADYKAVDLLPKSSRNWTCDKKIIQNYPFWRFGTYHYFIVHRNNYQLPSNFNWVSGIENFKGRITIISSTCGAMSVDFQKNNLKTLPQAEMKIIDGAGHITLFTDFAQETIQAIRSALR